MTSCPADQLAPGGSNLENLMPGCTQYPSYCTVRVPKKVHVAYQSAHASLYEEANQSQMDSYTKFMRQGAELQAAQQMLQCSNMALQELQLCLYTAQQTNLSLSLDLAQMSQPAGQPISTSGVDTGRFITASTTATGHAYMSVEQPQTKSFQPGSGAQGQRSAEEGAPGDAGEAVQRAQGYTGRQPNPY